MSIYQPYYSSYQPQDNLFGDDVLAQRVELFLATQGVLGLQLGVHAGRVTLRGSRATARQRDLIEVYCRHVAGVRCVVNEITVRVPKPRTRPTKSPDGEWETTTTSSRAARWSRNDARTRKQPRSTRTIS